MEAIITVGNEFSSVEALWSQFEGVMGKEGQEDTKAEGETKTQVDGATADASEAVEESVVEGEEGEEETIVDEGRGRR